jgi:hypothetical protein
MPSGGAADPGSWNRYGYVGGDPVNWYDPDGLFQQSPDGPSYDPGREIFGLAQARHGPPMPPKMLREPSHEWDALSDKCKEGLSQAMKGRDNSHNQTLRLNALSRTRDRESSLRAIAAKHKIDWRLLAGIGIRESHAGVLLVEAKGKGRGYFQIDIGQNPDLSIDPMDFAAAADWSAARLAANAAQVSREHSNFTPAQLLQATAASWNLGPHDFSGNPNTIDVGSKDHNYGRSIVNLTECFD